MKYKLRSLPLCSASSHHFKCKLSSVLAFIYLFLCLASGLTSVEILHCSHTHIVIVLLNTQKSLLIEALRIKLFLCVIAVKISFR